MNQMCVWCNKVANNPDPPTMRTDGQWWHASCWRMHVLGEGYR